MRSPARSTEGKTAVKAKVFLLQSMAESIDEEMEAMILMDEESKRIENLQAQIVGLTQQVRQLVEKQSQVCVVPAKMGEYLAEMRSLVGKGTRKAENKKSPKSTSADLLLIDSVCNGLEVEIGKIEQLVENLNRFKSVDLVQLEKNVAETLEQARYDDSAMRKLSQILSVDSTQVVESIQRILGSGIDNSQVEEPRIGGEGSESSTMDNFQDHGEAQSSDRTAGNFQDALKTTFQ